MCLDRTARAARPVGRGERLCDGRLQLKYAANDARAFGDAMRKAGTGLFSSVNVVTLLDADVTAEKLDAAFAEMAGP